MVSTYFRLYSPNFNKEWRKTMEQKKEKMNVFGFDGSFIQVFDKIFDVLVLGFLWILCSIPMITIGASSTALYYAIVKCVKNQDGYASKEFFHAFKENFIPATIIWIAIVAASCILHLNIGILMEKTSGYFGLFFICFYAAAALYVILAACYAFPALSRFDMGAGWFIKLSFYMVVKYFGTTLALLLILICTVILVFKIPMLMFFLPGPVAFVMSDFLERVLKKHEPQNEEKNM